MDSIINFFFDPRGISAKEISQELTPENLVDNQGKMSKLNLEFVYGETMTMSH